LFFKHFWNLIYRPKATWRLVRKQKYGLRHCYFTQLSWLAAVPSVSFYIGTTQMGWSVRAGEYHTLAHETAWSLSVVLYASIIAFVTILAFATYMFGRVYGAKTTFRNSMVLATFVAAPMLGAGIVVLVPAVWFVAIALLIAMVVALYLLFTGVPIMMKVSEERGMLFSFALVTTAFMIKTLYFTLLAFMFVSWSSLTTI